MNEHPTLKVAIIGFDTHIGNITKALANSPDLRLTAFVDRQETLEARKKEFGGNGYTEYREMLEREEIDIACIANNPRYRAEIIGACLDRGIHVIADKPLVTEQGELEQVKDRLRRNPKVSLSMLLTLRGDGKFRLIRDVVQDGQIGQILCAYAKRSFALKRDKHPDWFWDSRNTGGPTVELSLHDVDVVSWITGQRYTEVVAYESKRGHPDLPNFIDAGSALYGLENGGAFFVQHDRHVQAPLTHSLRLVITGTKGEIEYHNVPREEIWLATEGQTKVLEDMPPNVSIFRDWVDSLRNPGHAPILSTGEVLAVMENVLKARQSAQTGQKVKLGSGS